MVQLLLLLLLGCSQQAEFEIVLDSGETYLTDADILSYNIDRHELNITPEAAEKIKDIDVPLRGRGFSLRIEGDEKMRGALWTPISSLMAEEDALIMVLPGSTSLYLEKGFQTEGEAWTPAIEYLAGQGKTVEEPTFCREDLDCVCSETKSGERIAVIQKYLEGVCPFSEKAICEEHTCVLCKICPLYTPFPPGWCDKGRIFPMPEDRCGCPQPPKCIG